MTTEPLAAQMLRANLDARAPEREAFVARLVVGLTLGSLAVVFVLVPADRKSMVVRHSPAFLAVVAYHVVLLLALRRGWFHPLVPWIDAAVQTSMFAVPYYLNTSDGTAAQYTMPVAWISLIALSALKAKPAISIMAGVLGAAEYVGLTFAAAGERVTGGEVFVEGAFFVLGGVTAAAIATYLIRQAQHALHAVREQDLFGKYFMHERLGVGGMAEVFRATYSPEGGFEKVVAVKRVLPAIAAAADGKLFVDMFREEARMGAQLAHPNVIQVLDAGTFRDSYVLTMEYVDGVSLHRVLRSGRALSVATATFVAAELAAALDYIHSRVGADGVALGIVHRDVNPPNVLVSKLGEVKLSDFGVAHAVNRASLDPKRIYGKLGYLAPEQLHGPTIDGRADLFALGLTLYEMLAGKPVMRGKSLGEVDDFRLPEAELAALPHAGDIPDELRRLIRELLSPNPDARPTTGAMVRTRLLALSGVAAPFPHGQRELAAVVGETIDHDVEPAPPSATAATVPAKSGT